MNIGEVCAATGGRLLQGDDNIRVGGVSIDSRSLQAGDLFFALPGAKTDGHAFVKQAMAGGAAGVVVSRPPVEALPGAVVQVQDPLVALQELAGWKRRQFKGTVIGITGSNGKTTTKDMVAAVISTKEMVHRSVGNYNNEIGLPLTILSMPDNCTALVLEMGMRGMGQIARLCEIAQPVVGVLTNIGTSHLELLGSVENIASAKGELLEAIPTGGVAVVNGDDPRCREQAVRCRGKVWYFGLRGEADIRALNLQPQGQRGIHFTAVVHGMAFPVQLPVPGVHNVLNALAALGVGFVLGCDMGRAAAALTGVRLSPMRLEHRPGRRGCLIINDAYNASPSSMKASLEVLANFTGRRRVAVLGDMLELGEMEVAGHREVGAAATGAGVDLLFAVGRRAVEIGRGAQAAGMPAENIFYTCSAEETIAGLERVLQPGDVVLIKASRGMQLERIADALAEADSRS